MCFYNRYVILPLVKNEKIMYLCIYNNIYIKRNVEIGKISVTPKYTVVTILTLFILNLLDDITNSIIITSWST